ncbi:aminotransferase class V-fold PLP-dependent enzyme [Streptomyces clavuligerus]|uniref:aminotransferase class V-fold PLP-dependent enzyme n=1 Tax=Streptomyces clavuligerus TaxID=1901 RepID=UPI001E35BB96|nr:aminotransferase class V-fold PLP-dependent enzyme [Streptomyces clavuligerus]
MAENVTRTDSRGAGGGPGPDGAEDPERTGRTAGPGLFARIREDEYGYLDETGHVYLDHTGAALPARRQLRAQAERLTRGVFGNPHTESPASATSTALVERARARVLDFVGADPDEYTVVFTANATAACRLVGESYPFRRGRAELLLTLDNHNSVNGLREFARARRAPTTYVPPGDLELRVCDATLDRALRGRRGGRGLFAYPAQSNFSGVHHPWSGFPVPGNSAGTSCSTPPRSPRPTPAAGPLARRLHRGELVQGVRYPTGVGCLIARTEALALLRRPWFSGGTIQVAPPRADGTGSPGVPRPSRTARSTSMPSRRCAPASTGSTPSASKPSTTMSHGSPTRHLSGLERLCHSDGRPLIRLYGPRTRTAGAAPWRSTSSTHAVPSSTSASSPAIPRRPGSPFVRGASATPGRAKPPSASAGHLARRRVGGPPGRRAGHPGGVPDPARRHIGRRGPASAGIPTTPEDVDTCSASWVTPIATGNRPATASPPVRAADPAARHRSADRLPSGPRRAGRHPTTPSAAGRR